MRSADPPGHLRIGEHYLLPDDLARLAGEAVENIGPMLERIIAAGLAIRDEYGHIVSPHIANAAARKEQRRLAGRKGGNPVLIKGEPA